MNDKNAMPETNGAKRTGKKNIFFFLETNLRVAPNENGENANIASSSSSSCPEL